MPWVQRSLISTTTHIHLHGPTVKRPGAGSSSRRRGVSRARAARIECALRVVDTHQGRPGLRAGAGGETASVTSTSGIESLDMTASSPAPTILVVGAGPTGLTLAAQLRAFGAPFRI